MGMMVVPHHNRHRNKYPDNYGSLHRFYVHSPPLLLDNHCPSYTRQLPYRNLEKLKFLALMSLNYKTEFFINILVNTFSESNKSGQGNQYDTQYKMHCDFCRNEYLPMGCLMRMNQNAEIRLERAIRIELEKIRWVWHDKMENCILKFEYIWMHCW